jgi:hypothetical protein
LVGDLLNRHFRGGPDRHRRRHAASLWHLKRFKSARQSPGSGRPGRPAPEPKRAGTGG